MSGKTPLPFPRTGPAPESGLAERNALFHRLNNQLGVILANAELLESRLREQEGARARAEQIVAGAIAAIGTARDIRALLGPSSK